MRTGYHRLNSILLPMTLLLFSSVLCAETGYEVQQDDTLANILRQQGYGETYAELLPFIE